MFNSPITFKEASDALTSRLPEATALKYREILAQWAPEARQRAFFSARVADATLLSEIRSRVQAVVNGTMTNKQAVRLLRESFAGEDADALAALGFAPKRDAQGIAQLASIPRLKLIMDTNVRMAQECGHYRQWDAVKEFYPIGVWHCGYSEVHRREHLARDGQAFAFGHPIWTQSPPGGEFNCHCWRENMTAEAAARRGIVPQPEDFPFVPSSLGFDPSRPLDGSTVKPGSRVLPQFAQQAKDAKCPDDVLKDMAGDQNKDIEERRKKAMRNALNGRREDFARSAMDYGNLDISPLPDAINDKNAVVESRRQAAEEVARVIPEMYDEGTMMYGRPPRVCYDERCKKTLVTPDGMELVIGEDLIRHKENARAILEGLDFRKRMKNGQLFRKEFAKRQIAQASILGVKTSDITFVNDAMTKDRLRKEAVKNSNPNYGTGLLEWRNNCQRCVVAAELRRKGLNVVAKPRIMNGVDDAANHWTTLNSKSGFVFTNKKATKKDVVNAVEALGEGGRATIYVVWNKRSAHVFCAEVRHGRAVFYDPQSGADNYEPFNYAKGRLWGISRTDNTLLEDYINSVVSISAGRMINE